MVKHGTQKSAHAVLHSFALRSFRIASIARKVMTMRIGEITRLTGVSKDTVRFYERQGLLDAAPQPGMTNNYKQYSAQALRRIELIGHAKALGFTLREIAEVIAVWQENALDGETKRIMLETKIAQIDDKARSMAVLRAGLVDALAKVETGCADGMQLSSNLPR